MSWLGVCRTCCHFLTSCILIYVLPFFVQSMSLNTDMITILSSKRFWILPVQIPFLMSKVEALDNTCQMNCTAWVAKFNFSTNPCSLHTSSTFVAQLLDESVFETPNTIENLGTRELSSWSIKLLGRTVSMREVLEIVRICNQISHKYCPRLDCKIRAPPRSATRNPFAGSSNFLMSFFSLSIWMEMEFFSLAGFSVEIFHQELDAPASSSCPDFDAPGVVLVTL